MGLFKKLKIYKFSRGQNREKGEVEEGKITGIMHKMREVLLPGFSGREFQALD